MRFLFLCLVIFVSSVGFSANLSNNKFWHVKIKNPKAGSIISSTKPIIPEVSGDLKSQPFFTKGHDIPGNIYCNGIKGSIDKKIKNGQFSMCHYWAQKIFIK